MNTESNLTIEQAKDALIQLVKLINEDAKLVEIKESCSNDMMKYIELFLPEAIELQYKIISKYGFAADIDGLLEFTNQIKTLSNQDDSIEQLFNSFKNQLIPPLTLRTQCV